jgi:transcriptional regulator with XRE-family HTH domain
VSDTIDFKSLRRARGLTQHELAELIGVGQNRVSEIESTPDSVSFGQLRHILAVLGFRLNVQPAEGWSRPSHATGAHVYVFHHKRLPLIKIGKSVDAPERAEQIGDLRSDKGTLLRVNDEASAFRLERVLHRAFHNWRIDAEQALQHGLVIGKSEWFKNDCEPRLLKFLEDNSDLLFYRIETFCTGSHH